MDKEKMLAHMCADGLSQADIKAICKIRNLPAICLKVRQSFQHHFLNETGVEKVSDSLAEKEKLLLHLLNATGKAVDVEFFTRLYEEEYAGSYGYTFNQQYKGVSKRIKSQLIRKGLLLNAETFENLRQRSCALEGQRFLFPSEFVPFLPPPIKSIHILPLASQIQQQNIIRDKLTQILKPTSPIAARKSSNAKTVTWRLRVKDGNLLIDNQLFSIKNLINGMHSRWASAVKITYKLKNSDLSPVDLVLYALTFLEETEWMEADAIVPLWKMAYPNVDKLPDPHLSYQQGWQLGCLEKLTKDGKNYYRPRQIDNCQGEQKPKDFLSISDPKSIEIDVASIPLQTLEDLNKLCNLVILHGKLMAQPNLVKISHASAQIKKTGVFIWLRKQHKSFKQFFNHINKQQGKVFVHDNLMLARINDLSLKVQIEKKFSKSAQVISLSEQYIAFPIRLLPEIQTLVSKSGNATKFVRANERF